MNRRWTWAVSMAVACGVVAFGGEAANAADERVSFPAGIKNNEGKEDPGDIHKTFETLAEAAMTKGGFDDVIERLADQDRNRVGKFAGEKFTTLDGRVDQLRKAWKDKYGKDFKVDRDKAFAQVAVVRGEIDDPRQVASNWPVPAIAEGQAQGDAVTAGASQRAKTDDARSKPGLDSNIEKGRDVAIATVPESHGLPRLNVSLIHEAQGWRVDVPNTLAGRDIHDRLLAHLTFLGDNSNLWPADANDAAARFTHHVLMAVYGLDVPQSRQQRQAPPGTAGGSQNRNAVDRK